MNKLEAKEYLESSIIAGIFVNEDAEAIEAILQDDWISVENPPSKDGDYLGYNPSYFRPSRRIQNVEYHVVVDCFFDRQIRANITHWRPLLESPEGKL